MQHGEAHIFGGFLGAQQRLAPVGGDRLVGFDPPEAGIFVAQVAKTGHQQPFVRRGAGLVERAGADPSGASSLSRCFERQAFLQQRRQRLAGSTRAARVTVPARWARLVSGEMLKCTMMLGYMETKSISATSWCRPTSGW